MKEKVNQFKGQNEELIKQVASTESLNVALDKKNKEIVQEFINTVNKANEQNDKIKIEYDKLLKGIEERDNYITLQKTQYKNLNKCCCDQNCKPLVYLTLVNVNKLRSV